MGFSPDAVSQVDHTNLVEDIGKFCHYIDEIIDIYEMSEPDPEIHRLGSKANLLAVTLGVMCQDCLLARAWPKLQEYIKAAIIALIKTSMLDD